MKTKMRVWLMSFVMALGLLLSAGQGAWARSTADDLPATKEPSSARFDVAGSITSTGDGDEFTIQISGAGRMAGENLQMDMTMTAPEIQPAPGSPNSFTISLVTIDNKMYFKMTGLSTTGEEDIWYVSDLADAGLMPGMTGGITGLDPALAEALTVTQLGKEAIHGVSTTRYKVDFDLVMLGSMGGEEVDPSTAEALENATMTMYMWVGDTDMYLHQMRLEMNVEIAEPGDGPSSALMMDLTMTFKEFDQPVNIVAPPNAQPLDLSGSGLLEGIPGGAVIGMPISAGAGMGRGMGMGMPRSGSSDNMAIVTFASLGLALLGGGYYLRRRSERVGSL